MEVLRDKYKALELRMGNLMRLASENEAIANKFHRWTQILLQSEDVGSMPHAVTSGLKSAFDVPQVTLRIWGTAPDYLDEWFVKGVSEDARIFANSLLARTAAPTRTSRRCAGWTIRRPWCRPSSSRCASRATSTPSAC
jgi:uncharacterized protein YigA (DUF484 family)